MWRLLTLWTSIVQEQLKLLEILIILKNKKNPGTLRWDSSRCVLRARPHLLRLNLVQMQIPLKVNSFERREPEVRMIVKRFSLPQESMPIKDSLQ